MRESRTYGSVRGACDETHVPTATRAPRVHHAARRRGGAVADSRQGRSSAIECGISACLWQPPQTDADGQARSECFRKGVNELGWTEDRNLRIDIRWAGATSSASVNMRRTCARETRRGSGRCNSSTAAPLHARHAPYRSYLYGFPIRLVRVSSRACHGPSGNVTGFVTNFEPQLAGKWVELLKEIGPNLAHVSFIYNPQTAPYTGPFIHSFEAAARELGVKPIVKPIFRRTDIDAVYRSAR